jgi:hypothetical protein
MELTEREREKIQEEFAARRKRQMLALIPAFGVMLLLVILENRVTSMVLTVLLVAVIGTLFVFSLRNWRCPACEGHLGRGMSPRFCSKCGVQLRP